MNKFLNWLSGLSVKTILLINFILAILILIPLSVVLSQQQTQLTSKAYNPLPTLPPIVVTTPTPAPIIPSGPPIITNLLPFYGKAGDSVIIEGSNFGSIKDKITFNNIPATDIKFWTNDKIHVIVPQKASSGLIKVKSVNSDYNFIVYDVRTPCELVIKSQANKALISVSNCPSFSKIKLVLQKDNAQPEIEINPPLAQKDLKLTSQKNNTYLAEITIPDQTASSLFSLNLVNQTKLLSAEIWNDTNLIPFFINPLSIGE